MAKTLAQLGREHEDLVAEMIMSKAKDIEGAMMQSLNEGTGIYGAPVIPPGIKESADAAKRRMLDDTQNMRVVALNEACGVAKEMIAKGAGVPYPEITRMAAHFAKYLIDGKY